MSAPEALGARGKALWTDVSASTSLDHAGRLLLEEACRTADRLERLHELLSGGEEAWATVDQRLNGRIVLSVTGLLAETRAQQAALTKMLAHLRLGRGAASAPSPAGGPPEGRKGGLDELSGRRAARRGAASTDRGRAGGDE